MYAVPPWCICRLNWRTPEVYHSQQAEGVGPTVPNILLSILTPSPNPKPVSRKHSSTTIICRALR